ncbi:hypothetical protein ACSLNG_07235, partial [Escherichia fergusonii]|uniref:hypothetical protein n=1 Tax=Escherichia fergusonii TaxID=564 RepID=UPI003EE2E0C9
NGDELTTVTADGSGNWSYQLTEPLSEGGTYNFTASQLTSDGSSGQSPNYAITILINRHHSPRFGGSPQ